MVARLLVLAYGTANARMRVWNGSICALGAVGEPAISDLNDDVVWVQPFPVSHARNASALLDLNSFPEPHIHIRLSLLYHGVVFITMTLKHYCVYMLKCYDRDSHRMAGAWSIGFGYGIQSHWYGQLKYVHFISMHLINIWLMRWLSMIPGMAIGCF